MSGWIDFIEEEINCHHCGKRITVQFCEDGDPDREPIVITGLAGIAYCTICNKKIMSQFKKTTCSDNK
jgi:DNA-directed RNA polymerase subunit RPC12/RpoP